MSATDATTRTAVKFVLAITEVIREVGEIPNGHLYAQCMNVMTFETYSSIIDIIKRTGLVSESGNVLKWIGPLGIITGGDPAQVSAHDVLDRDRRAAFADATSAAFDGAAASARGALEKR